MRGFLFARRSPLFIGRAREQSPTHLSSIFYPLLVSLGLAATPPFATSLFCHDLDTFCHLLFPAVSRSFLHGGEVGCADGWIPGSGRSAFGLAGRDVDEEAAGAAK